MAGAVPGPVVLLLGGRRGVGVTFLTDGLAAALAARGCRASVTHVANAAPPSHAPDSSTDAGRSDLCLLDGGGAGPEQIKRCGLRVSLLLLVTDADPLTTVGAYSELKQLWLAGRMLRTALVVNRADAAQIAATQRRFRATATRFLGLSIEDWGGIATASAATRGARADSAALGRQLRGLAERLVVAPPRRRLLWPRVASVFL